MSTERDRDMQRLLGSETPPEHGPGFWDDLRSDLHAEAGAATGTVSMAGRRRPLPWLLAAAAIAVIGAAIGFGALRDTSDDAKVLTEPDVEDTTPDTRPDPSAPEPTIEDTATTEPSDPETALMPVGEGIDRGSGTVVGISPDGRWVYVTDDAGSGDGGCEGTPQRALYVQPIDGGERTLAAPADLVDATTLSTLHFDGDGRVAMVVQCEGFEARIVAASIGGDGTLTDIGELTLPEPDEACSDEPVDGVSDTVDAITDITYVSSGMLVAATASFGEWENGCRSLYHLPDRASEPTLLDQEDVFLVEAAADGQIVTATGQGVIRVDGEEIIDTTDVVYDLDVSPDGTTVAVVGSLSTIIIPIHGGDGTTLAWQFNAVTLRDAGSGAALLIDSGDLQSLVALDVTTPDALEPLIGGGPSSGAFVSLQTFFSPDGSSLYLTVSDENGENPRVIEQPVTT